MEEAHSEEEGHTTISKLHENVIKATDNSYFGIEIENILTESISDIISVHTHIHSHRGKQTQTSSAKKSTHF